MNLTPNSITAMWIAIAIWVGGLSLLFICSATFRARCRASLIVISRPGLRLRIYLEKTKYSGQLFGQVTCIAVVTKEGSVYRVLYGTPNPFAFHYMSLSSAANCYKVVAQRIKH